jgi:hypothetical protein
MKIKMVLAVFIFLFSFSSSFCQNTDTVLIIPGHPSLQSSQLKDYTAKYDFISYKDGVEKPVGGLEDDFKIITKDGQKMGLRICNITFGPNRILDSGLCILKGLKPVYHRSVQTKRTMSLDFNNEIITGTITPAPGEAAKTETVNYTAALPLFDSYYEDMIAKTITLKKGMLFKFPEYIYERGGIVWSFGEIAGTVETQEKDPLWKIVFYERSAEGKTIRTTTYLITQTSRDIFSREYKTETGRMLMKQRKG